MLRRGLSALKRQAIALFSALLLFQAAPSTCSGKLAGEKQKDYWENINFDKSQFESVIELVGQNYIDKDKIDKVLAYAEAARFAVGALPAGLQLYPAEFFKKRKQYASEDEIILPGKAIRLSTQDGFLIFAPNYENFEKRRKARREKIEAEEKAIGSDEKALEEFREKKIREQVRIDKSRKKAWVENWHKTNFNRADFNRVIAWIEKNQKKYLEYPKIEEDDASERPVFTMKRSWLAAANGYLSALDPHCALFSAARWEEQIKETQDSSFEGIGALLRGGGSSPTIVENPLEGRPAVEAGLRAGDEIVKVDNQNIRGWQLQKVVNVIRGEKGSKVVLVVKRKGYNKELPITIVRQTIDIKNVTSKFLENFDDIGYIKLTGFVNNSTEEIIDHFKALQKKNPKMRGLILDLRNNPGGLLNEAVRIADLFIPNGVIVTVKNPTGKNPKQAQVHQASMLDLTTLPLAVLINARSASASEIVASAIQDHKRGLVLGERSFGKASVQQLFPNTKFIMSQPEYYTKLTISRYYAPSGRTIQVTGVGPDVEVSDQLDGTFHYQFREEDLWNHLDSQDATYESPQKNLVAKLKTVVEKVKKAQEILEKSKNAAIKPDIQLVRSAEWLDAAIAVK